jgi:integrase
VSLTLESRAYCNFIEAIHSPKTKELYHNALMRYTQHYQISIDELLSLPIKAIEQHIVDYLIKNKSYMGKKMIVNSLKKFYEMNDVVLNWKKLSQYLGEYQRTNKDRAYNHDEIKTLVDRADVRMKAILLLLATTGIRIGAIPELKIRHLTGNKITVYENTKEEYITFCTPETENVVGGYLDYRRRSGEKLSPDSPLFRKQFDMNDLEQIRKESEPIKLNTLNKLLDLHLQRCGLRTVDHVESKRKEIARAHGFRKFFTTQLVNARINPEIREMLLGHKIGLSSAYYRPTENDILVEYEKAIDVLTIDPANRLRKKVETLTIEKSKVDLALSQIEEMKKRLRL